MKAPALDHDADEGPGLLLPQGSFSPRTWSASSRASSRSVLRSAGDLDVGRDALVRDRDVLGGEVLGDGQVDSRAVGKRDRLLHRSLAEGRLADERREVVVGQRRRQDLGRGRRAAVDQDDRRHGVEGVAQSVVDLLAGRAAARRDDVALLDEDRGRSDRLVQAPAAVPAQVEDEPLGPLALEALDLGAKLCVGALVEARVDDVADLAAVDVHDAPLRRGERDLGALDLDVLRAAASTGLTGQLDLGADLALDLRRRDLGGNARQVLAVRGEDHVADGDPGALGRRVGKHRGHLEALGDLLDRKADALEVAAQRLLELARTPSGRSSGRTCRRTPCGARRSCRGSSPTRALRRVTSLK